MLFIDEYTFDNLFDDVLSYAWMGATQPLESEPTRQFLSSSVFSELYDIFEQRRDKRRELFTIHWISNRNELTINILAVLTRLKCGSVKARLGRPSIRRRSKTPNF